MIAVSAATAAADAKSKIADMEQNNRLAGILVGESIGIVLTTAAGVMGSEGCSGCSLLVHVIVPHARRTHARCLFERRTDRFHCHFFVVATVATMATSTIRSTAKRLLMPAAVASYPAYKAKCDPPHVIWDLDNTILCSISPHPCSSGESSDETQNDDKVEVKAPLPTDSCRYFDQIDDDFPFEDNIPNTRTYWRPGAKAALQICNLFCVQHVYTTAQRTYTDNIMAELDPKGELFQTIVHRDLRPDSVKRGKDLSVITDRLDRAILFDDKIKNFCPQGGQNGIQTKPYDEAGVRGGDVTQILEMARLVGISVMALVATDVRDIVPFFNSQEHREWFKEST